MRRRSSVLGLIGIILLLFAGVATWLTRGRTNFDVGYIAINGSLGLLALAAFLRTGLGQFREALGQRSTKFGASTAVGSLIFVAIVVVLNVISARNHHRFDLTEQGIYSLAPQSIQVLTALADELKVQAFVEGGVHPALEDTFRTYAYHSPKFRYELLDPVKEPQLAEQFSIRAYNSVRVQYGAESTIITDPTEQSLTNAIIKVTRGEQKLACFVEGHGESDLDDTSARGLSAVKTALENENYRTEKLLLATEPSVPERCSVLAIVGPTRPFIDGEIQAIDSFLSAGGRALVLLRPRASQELIPLLSSWGIHPENSVVVDQVVRIFEGPTLGLSPLARSYGSHEITRDLRQITIYPMARSLRLESGAREGLQVTSLVQTSESSWAESDLEALFDRSEAALDVAADQRGPVTIAAASQLQAPDGSESNEMRLVVFGSAQFADNREIDGTYFNRDLLMNSFAWLVGEGDLVSIRPRAMRASRAQFTPEQGTVIFYLSVLLIPQLLLLTGIAVWWRRE